VSISPTPTTPTTITTGDFVMMKGLIEAMLLDINRNTKTPWGERNECGMVVDSSAIPLEEHIKYMEIYDWSIEKQLRKLNWEDLKETRLFIKPKEN
jgi:hypothetical protein